MRDAALARAVSRHEAAAEEGEHRGEIDDASARLAQLGARARAQAHGPRQIDREHALEHLDLVLLDAADDAGAVHENIEPVERIEDAAHAGVVGHVQLDGADPVLGGAKLIRTEPGGDHPRAKPAQQPGHAFSDALRPARDEDGLSAQEIRLEGHFYLADEKPRLASWNRGAM